MTGSPLTFAKPPRVLFDDPQLSHVVEMIMALGAELAVALDQIDTMKRLMAQKGVVTLDDFDAYRPDAAASAARNCARADLVRNILAGLDVELD